jgi:hypothetical protein
VRHRPRPDVAAEIAADGRAFGGACAARGRAGVRSGSNVQQVLDVVDRAYLLEVGSIKLAGTSSELKGHAFIRKAYLGL